MKIEIKKISELKPADYNPRKSSITQDENLKQSLEKFGVVEPIVFNSQTGNIVGGHFRVRQLKKLGYKEVECVIVDLPIEDEKELNIRLNANTGEFDYEILQSWDQNLLQEWGVDIPNFEPAGGDPFADEGISAQDKFGVIVMCDSAISQEEVFNDLTEKGFKCKIVVV